MSVSNCRKCGESKPQEEFPFRADSGKYRTQCKVCYKKYMRNQHFLRTYNISMQDVEEMLDKQDGKCLICEDTLCLEFQKKQAHVDHCHENGHVRGILCQLCNHGLGSFRDNINSLKKAITYLEDNSVCI